MRSRGRSRIVFAVVVAFAALAPAAYAATPTRAPAASVDPAIAMYVEQVPTSSGPVAADKKLQRKSARVEASSGGTVVFVVALALATAAFGGTAFRRLRREKP